MDEENNNNEVKNEEIKTEAPKSNNEKTKSILSYVFGWIAGLIVLYGVKDNEKATKFHAAQAIVLSAIYTLATMFLSWVPYLTKIMGLVYIVGVIIGIVKVTKPEEDPALPLVGDLAKSIFGKKLDEE